MAQKFKPSFGILAGFGFLTGMILSTAAQAQLPQSATSTANPARVEEQFKDRDFAPSVEPEVEVRDLILQKAPEGAENILFQLNSLILDGVTVYSEDQLQPVYADKLGATVSLADIYTIAAQLTNKYRNEGYILTQVIVPPQTIEGGVVHLQVIEGYINTVTVEGAGGESLGLIRDYTANIKTGRALNVRDLERYLLLVNDLPGVEARSVLSPSTETGAADLRVIVTRDHFDGLVAIDNYGSKFLGPVQVSSAGNLNSIFGMNELIAGQFVITPELGDDRDDSKELVYFATAYEQPIGDNGTRLALNGTYSKTNPGDDLTVFNVKGISRYVNMKVSHPFIRARSQNLTGYALVDWRNVDSKSLIDRRIDNIRAVRAGGTYEFLDTLMGVGLNSVNLEVAKGIDVLGASEEGSTLLTRQFGDPQFFKINAEVQRLQRLSSSFNLLVAARGQWASDAQLSSEEFGIGGINYGRGYDPSEVVGDDGVAGKVELQWKNPVKMEDVLENSQLFGFYDAGTVWNQDATTGPLKRDTVTSTGFGVRAEFTGQIKGEAIFAVPLNRDVQTMGDQDPRVFMSLSKRF